MSVEENIKGECEGDEEDGEDDESLHERLEDLHEHHHVDSKEVKPKPESTRQLMPRTCLLNHSGNLIICYYSDFCRNNRELKHTRKMALVAHLPLQEEEEVEPGQEDGDGGALPLKRT